MKLRRIWILAALAACSEATAPPAIDTSSAQLAVVDAYQLRAHNGNALPWRVATGACEFTDLVDGALSLSDNGTVTRVLTNRWTRCDGVIEYQTVSQAGTYAVAGAVVSMDFGTFRGRGTVAGAVMTWTPVTLEGIVLSGETYRYER